MSLRACITLLAVYGRILAGLVLLFLANGCMEPGPRALLRGDSLLRQGKYAEATEQFQIATRLLPKNATAWNYLGLALHYGGQREAAQRAYRTALELDMNLSSAGYNLGCLLLEENQHAAAINQLTSYTYLQANNALGWVKLGTAQLRARRLDDAEKSFRKAVQLQPKNVEAINGLGNVYFHRQRVQEALNHFNQALAVDPEFSPAVLNAAIVSHQSLNNRPQALQSYKKYLALEPDSPLRTSVTSLVTQLDHEINPPLPLRVVTAPQPTVSTPTPPPARSQLTNPSLPAPSAHQPAKQIAETAPAKKPAPAPVKAEEPALPPKILTTAPFTNLVSTNAGASALVKTAAVPPKLPATPVEPPLPEAPAVPVEVAHVADDLELRPTQDIVPVRPSALSSNEVQKLATIADPVAQGNPRLEKRGWLTKLNPFSGRTKATAVTNNVVNAHELAEPPPPTPAATAPAPSIRHYAYARPGVSPAGNRAQAERAFTEALKAHRAGQLSQALQAYEQATRLDSAYYEAWYNLGLAAFDLRRWPESLRAYEHALAVKPDAVEARYNFALALKEAGYLQDAVTELRAVLQKEPGEARAHLSLANLFAYQLGQPKLAREHFLKVLELDPRHPQAPEIRYWIAAQK